jgi:hypothetical protein
MPATAAELALVNGRVRTLDPERPAASAVAVTAGRIVAVGDAVDVRPLIGPATETIDLGGAAVVPGLIDGHVHALPGSISMGSLDLGDAQTLDDVRARLAEERARCEPGGWIVGWGLDRGVFAEAGIRGELIEEAAGGLPVLLRFADFHTALASPRALTLAGVDGPRTFAEHAEIVCVDGVPTGELREAAATMLVQSAAPAPTASQRRATAVENLRRLAATGITAAHLMDGDPSSLDMLRDLEDGGDLRVRCVVPMWIKPEMERDEWEALAAHRDARGRRWRAGVVKLFMDGVVDSGTAWLDEPDADGAGTDPFWPDPARYREAVAFFSGRGFQCATHACGDRAVHEVLNAYRDAPRAAGVRHRIEHVELLRAEDLPRFAAEGVIASMQAQHMTVLEPDGGDGWSRRVGPQRWGRAYRARDLHESGAWLVLGSDWPVVRHDPREGMAAARLRRPPGRRDRGPWDDQALTALQALLGYTTWAARAVGHGDQGRIAPGCLGDLTVLARDPVDCDADDLLDDPVLLTVVDGEVTHRDPSL